MPPSFPPVPCRAARRPLLSRRRLAAAAAAALAGGCSVLPERPYVETRRFTLSPRRPGGAAAPGGAGRKVLLLRLVRAAPGLEQRGLRTLRPDGSVQVDFYNEWAAPPAELAEEAIRRWLSESGLFAAVTSPGSRAEADLVLEIELTALQAEIRADGRGVARAALAGVLLDRGGRVLAQLTPRGEAALPRDAAPDGGTGGGSPPPERVAAAAEAALGEALAALERGLARFAS
ncbi:ABC-type transport auxiliary lipoprotein family protein [Caldovatus aquaticus]|uniref:ABC-type transport auxiliary lipoprotein family protein n=1 Tax=Caldovatus aquaticus TaxID=2865671 RepID=A0ABS7F5A2_9PROT|nr:ABC-type transport auxiliary lipoprotein family protein [Caldovatus aquaticus]MBW8269976.1 ABC-type transport auxiliary lipoprotein family protein [Caldovatus aquaticus]